MNIPSREYYKPVTVKPKYEIKHYCDFEIVGTLEEAKEWVRSHIEIKNLNRSPKVVVKPISKPTGDFYFCLVQWEERVYNVQ